MVRTAWLLAGVLALVPATARAELPDKHESAQSSDPEGPQAIRLELGASLGDFVLAAGSATQLSYAPTLDLRVAVGLARVGALGFVRLAAPIRLPGGIATQQRQFSTGGGIGLRSMFVQRRRIRFGLWLAGTVDRLDSKVRLPELPGLPEREHVHKRVTLHAGAELGLELGVPLPVRRGPTTVLTFGAALAFVLPIAAARSGTDVAETRYAASELGVIGVAGGATVLVNLGVMLGWDREVDAGSRATRGQ